MNKSCTLATIVAALITLSIVPSSFGFSGSLDGPDSLIVVEYDNWLTLQQVARLRLNVLDLQDTALAAIASPAQIDQLLTLKAKVRMLESPANSKLYYLIQPRPGADFSLAARIGHIFSYQPNLFILKAEPAKAESLVAMGFMILKLNGPIVLPSSSPSLQPVRARRTLAADPLIQSLVTQVSETYIRDLIQRLQDDPVEAGWDAHGSRYSYSSELDAKREYIANTLRSYGLSVRYHTFSLFGYSLSNIEATLRGRGPSAEIVYITCAHYDSTSTDSNPYEIAPGADDNASGTAGVLEAARILSRYEFERTIRFVLFPGEEQGLYGSMYYASECSSSGTDIGGVINLDMIGWDSNRDNAMDIHAGTLSSSQAIGTAFEEALWTYNLSLNPQYITQGSLTFSDHRRFWERGYPAILAIEDYSGDFNVHYHSQWDTLNNTNVSFIRKFVQADVATLARLARIIPPGLKIAQTGPRTILPGANVALSVRYENGGGNSATNVCITNTLAGGLTYVSNTSGLTVHHPALTETVWSLGDLSAGASGVFTLTAHVPESMKATDHVTSTLTIGGNIDFDDPTDNNATWTGFIPSCIWYMPMIVKEQTP